MNKKRDLPVPRLFGLFIAFILLCGLTHLADVVVFYWAPYRLFTALSVATAVASATTAASMPAAVRALVKLPTREKVHAINNQLQEEVLRRTLAEKELARKNEKLKGRVAELETAIKGLEELNRTNQWFQERSRAIQELHKLLSELEAI